MRRKPSKLVLSLLASGLALGSPCCKREQHSPYFSHVYHGNNGHDNQICIRTTNPEKIKLKVYRHGKCIDVPVKSTGPHHVYYQPSRIFLLGNGPVCSQITDENSNPINTFEINLEDGFLQANQ